MIETSGFWVYRMYVAVFYLIFVPTVYEVDWMIQNWKRLNESDICR